MKPGDLRFAVPRRHRVRGMGGAGDRTGVRTRCVSGSTFRESRSWKSRGGHAVVLRSIDDDSSRQRCNRSVNPVWTWERAYRTLALLRASTGRMPLRREGARTGSGRCSTMLALTAATPDTGTTERLRRDRPVCSSTIHASIAHGNVVRRSRRPTLGSGKRDFTGNHGSPHRTP